MALHQPPIQHAMLMALLFAFGLTATTAMAAQSTWPGMARTLTRLRNHK